MRDEAVDVKNAADVELARNRNEMMQVSSMDFYEQACLIIWFVNLKDLFFFFFLLKYLFNVLY